MQCATHPGVETELRCREHGLIPTPPIYRVTPAGYGAAVPAGLVLSAAMSFSSGWKRGRPAPGNPGGSASVGLWRASSLGQEGPLE